MQQRANRTWLARAAACVLLLLEAAPSGIAQSAPPTAAGPAATRVAPELERLNLAYFAELGTLRQQYEAADAQLLAQYAEAVARFARDAQAQGNFETWQAGVHEQERFAQAKVVRAEDLVAAPAPLRTLQERAIQTRAELRKTFAKNTVDLTDRLVARFDTMKRDLTIRGDAANAQLAVDAIARARATEAYTEALFALDDPAAALAANAPAPTEAAGAPATAPATPVRIPNTQGVRVYEPGYTPSAIGIAYRLCSMTETPGSTAAPAVVTATVRYAPRSQLVFRYPDESFTGDGVNIQVSLRALPGSGSVGPLVLVVEYFGRRFNSTPHSLTYTAANLASLDHRPVSVDMPITSHQIQQRLAPTGTVRRRIDPALQFGGVLVSVFDRTGNILYQGVSDGALLPFANGPTPYRSDGSLDRPETLHTP